MPFPRRVISCAEQVLTWINGSYSSASYVRRVIIRLIVSCLVSAQIAFAASSPADPPRDNAKFEYSLRTAEGELELRFNGRRLLLYAFGSSQFKPYVRELYTLRGDNILLDAPPDHLHHHGLMYGIRVNGENFWEERDQPGFQKPVRLDPPKIGRSASGLPQASFTQLIHWVPNKQASEQKTADVALLIERRTLTVTVDPGQQEVALTWHADFGVGPGAAKVTLTGAIYHGLGLRLPEAFNRVAQHYNSAGATYPSNGTGDVTSARWSAVSNAANGRDITVALFGQPSPTRGLPLFFTMVQPFTYLSVTQGLDKTPIEYSAGNEFQLEYLLVIYPRRCEPEFIQRRYQVWRP